MKKIQLGGHRYKSRPIRGYALVDDDDYKELSQYQWSLNSQGYAVRSVKHGATTTVILMHRQITSAPKGSVCDHINRNPLDNRKMNLRVCSQSQNSHNVDKSRNNKSGYKGVWWDAARRLWAVQICVRRKKYHIGRFKRLKDAARAYNKAARKYLGEFAYLNRV